MCFFLKYILDACSFKYTLKEITTQMFLFIYYFHYNIFKINIIKHL